MRIFPRLTLASIREALAAGHSLESLVTTWFERIDSRGDDAVWIWRPALEQVLATLPEDPTLPLYGMPFAIKDNIDVGDWPTTAGCPDFAYTAAGDATVIAKLRAAGAIPIGKTNLDQFATGLVGVRSPTGSLAASMMANSSLGKQFRLRGGGGCRLVCLFAWHGYRRVRPSAGSLQRDRRGWA